ncbi:HAEPLYID family protein [Hymenobacter sp. B81]|uniref:HAEPLYID family protein n=1 Tax=Hymenobacter sp. B81 TaxID=3344878 RepID=UPI0037DDB705
MKHLYALLGGLLLSVTATAQHHDADSTALYHERLDSLYIQETEGRAAPDKVLHAEPLFIDLIRDLGARKGEKEWNVGLGLTDNYAYDSHDLLVEYEWAPANRLGLEVEVPVTLYSGRRQDDVQRPAHRLNGLKTAVQYTFYVSEPRKLSLAVGYINELESNAFNRLARRPITGNGYSPFLVAAKRWADNYHTLIYTGPVWEQHFGRHGHTNFFYQLNSNFHYLIPGTRNFVGLEVNQEFRPRDFDLTFRPQMRLSIADNLLVGIVAGIPVNREQQRLSSFMRLIYEPGHRRGH